MNDGQHRASTAGLWGERWENPGDALLGPLGVEGSQEQGEDVSVYPTGASAPGAKGKQGHG